MGKSAKPTEQVAILGTIDAQTIKTTAVESDRVDPKLFQRLRLTVIFGTVTDNPTVTLFKATATTAGTTTALSSVSVAASSATLTQRVFNWDADQSYDTAAPYVGVKVSFADTNANTASAIIDGFNGEYLSASDNDLATVAIVN